MITVTTKVIDSTDGLASLVDSLAISLQKPTQTNLYVDLEGIKLGRNGSISIFTILIDDGSQTRNVYLVDVHTLGFLAFTQSGVKGMTLKDILQDEAVPKFFFDVRNDSDALFSHFGIALKGIIDVQLMESANRPTTYARQYVSGLTRCIEKDVMSSVGPTERAEWKAIKEKGDKLFKPELGGSYEVFNKRPMPEEIANYCVGDVQYLPNLMEIFGMGRSEEWRQMIGDGTRGRVAASQQVGYLPQGPDRAKAPWSAEQHRKLDAWN